jgi:hypothetical protein
MSLDLIKIGIRKQIRVRMITGRTSFQGNERTVTLGQPKKMGLSPL